MLRNIITLQNIWLFGQLTKKQLVAPGLAQQGYMIAGH
jgi:hypothetical protein